MFSHIKTSKANKEVVTQLTNKLNLGAENVIARIAIAYSLKEDKMLELNNLNDSAGKEYSRTVLFGDKESIYTGMICNLQGIHKSHIDLGKYVKLHLDNGLKSLHDEVYVKMNQDSFEFIFDLYR